MSLQELAGQFSSGFQLDLITPQTPANSLWARRIPSEGDCEKHHAKDDDEEFMLQKELQKIWGDSGAIGMGRL